MFEITLRKLTVWRNETARREGVDLFRVLPNKTLEDIARECPKDKVGLTGIKGIKEAKFRKYGHDIIRIVKESDGDTATKITKSAYDDLHYFMKKSGAENKVIEEEQKAGDETGDMSEPADLEKSEERIFTVGELWDVVNERLCSLRIKVRGEVSSVDIRNTAVYFSIKDKADESVMSCFIFRYQYDILAVDLKEGAEVVVHGYPEIYKPYGKISLRTDVIELEGEGALKKEYEVLKQKLAAEGMFDAANKKVIGRLPQRIGLLTSRDGAAIGDFRSNIGRYGFRIKFINSNVEGKRAVFELINAVRAFKRMNDLDALVIIRGGGSLESLQAFNNEALIREIKKLDVPVICGVGHDKDISLLSLSSDYSVSTPTAAARLIGGLWEREIDRIDYFEKNILDGFESNMGRIDRDMRDDSQNIDRGFQKILRDTEDRFDEFSRKALEAVGGGLADKIRALETYRERIGAEFYERINRIQNRIERFENTIRLNDPERQLKLGYGIISKNDAGVRSVGEIHEGDSVKIRFYDGEAQSQIKTIKKFKK